MITHVRLRDWKSHAQTELRFGDGTNLLVGGMGSGKSSVLEAISLGLFGAVPNLRERGVKLEELVRSKPQPRESAEVEVGFVTPDGEEYVVRRVVRKGGIVSSELRKRDGTLVEGSTSGKVTEVVERLLGLGYELFERAVYSQQNRLDYFLTLRPSERKRKIDELMGMDRLEEVRQKLGALSKKLSIEAEDRRKLAERKDKESLRRQLEELGRRWEEDRRKVEEMRHREGALHSGVEEARKRLLEMEELRRRVEGLRIRVREEGARVEQLRKQLEEDRARLGGAPDLVVLEGEVREAERAYSEARAEEEKISLALISTERRKGSLLAELQAMEKGRKALEQKVVEKEGKERWLREVEPEKLSARLEEVRRKLEEVRGELAEVRAREEEVRKTLEELSAAGSSCPVCDTPLEEARKGALRERRRRELQELGRRRAELESGVGRLVEEERRLSELERRVRTVEVEVKELRELREELKRMGEEDEMKRRELEVCEGELGNFRVVQRLAVERREGTSKRWQELRGRLELARDLVETERQLRDRQVQHLSLQRELWELERGYREEELWRRREEVQSLSSRLEGLRGELRGLERVLEEERGRMELLKKDLADLRKLELESLGLREVSEALGQIQTALSRTQSQMRTLFVEQVNQLMEDLWEEVYPYGDYTSLRLSVGEGGDYQFELRDRRGNWQPVEGVASGGERTDACFVMRVALARALAPGLGWIVLDEPTHNLDAEAIQELARVLRERLPTLVRQVLLITHEERLEAAVSGYLYRFHRDKAREEPTEVERVSPT